MDLPLTSDEELKELRDKDITTEIVAYVDEVVIPSEVGQNKKFMLFKFFLTNGSKRITCLVWGHPLIQKIEPLISINKIIHIDNGQCKAIAPNFYNESKNVIPFEIIIQKHTVVECIGTRSIQKNPETVTEVDFENIVNATGMIIIQGFIKTSFALSESRNQSMSFGCGAITDGVYKITIQITNFSLVNYKKGNCVKVTGVVKSDTGGPLFILCSDMSCIQRVEGVEDMPLAKVFKGVRSPKRLREE